MKTFEYSDEVEKRGWYFLFIFFWTTQFVVAMGQVVVALTVVKFYFTRDVESVRSLPPSLLRLLLLLVILLLLISPLLLSPLLILLLMLVILLPLVLLLLSLLLLVLLLLLLLLLLFHGRSNLLVHRSTNPQTKSDETKQNMSNRAALPLEVIARPRKIIARYSTKNTPTARHDPKSETHVTKKNPPPQDPGSQTSRSQKQQTVPHDPKTKTFGSGKIHLKS